MGGGRLMPAGDFYYWPASTWLNQPQCLPQWTTWKVEGRGQVPHACPICVGRGTVPKNFYSGGTMTTDLTPEQCRSCLGTGILWR